MSTFESRARITKDAMRYGFYLGIALSLIAVISYKHQVKDLTSAIFSLQISFVHHIVVWVAGLSISLVHYKRRCNGACMTFGRSWLFCMHTSLFASVILAMTYAILSWLDKGFIYSLYTEQVEIIKILAAQANFSEDLLEKQLNNLDTARIRTIKDLIISTIGNSVLYAGFFVGLLLSFIVKKKNKK